MRQSECFVGFFFQVYGTELEKVEVFNGFQDFVETFYIHRGKVKSKSDERDTAVGEFKVMKCIVNRALPYGLGQLLLLLHFHSVM